MADWWLSSENRRNLFRCQFLRHESEENSAVGNRFDTILVVSAFLNKIKVVNRLRACLLKTCRDIYTLYIFMCSPVILRGRPVSVLEPRDRGSTPSRGKTFFWLLSAHFSLLFTGYRGTFPDTKQATHVHLVSLRMGGAIPGRPQCLHGLHTGRCTFLHTILTVSSMISSA
jgi:hypothetical protein